MNALFALVGGRSNAHDHSRDGDGTRADKPPPRPRSAPRAPRGLAPPPFARRGAASPRRPPPTSSPSPRPILAPARARRVEDRLGGSLHRARVRPRADYAEPGSPRAHRAGRRRVPRPDPRRGPRGRRVRAADDPVPDGQHERGGHRGGGRVWFRARVQAVPRRRHHQQRLRRDGRVEDHRGAGGDGGVRPRAGSARRGDARVRGRVRPERVFWTRRFAACARARAR